MGAKIEIYYKKSIYFLFTAVKNSPPYYQRHIAAPCECKLLQPKVLYFFTIKKPQDYLAAGSLPVTKTFETGPEDLFLRAKPVSEKSQMECIQGYS